MWIKKSTSRLFAIPNRRDAYLVGQQLQFLLIGATQRSPLCLNDRRAPRDKAENTAVVSIPSVDKELQFDKEILCLTIGSWAGLRQFIKTVKNQKKWAALSRKFRLQQRVVVKSLRSMFAKRFPDPIDQPC